MKIYVETPVKVEKGDFLVVDDVYEKGCHCGTRKYVVQLIKTTEESLAQELDKDIRSEDFQERTSCYL
jgi:hypothetical protein